MSQRKKASATSHYLNTLFTGQRCMFYQTVPGGCEAAPTHVQSQPISVSLNLFRISEVILRIYKHTPVMLHTFLTSITLHWYHVKCDVDPMSRSWVRLHVFVFLFFVCLIWLIGSILALQTFFKTLHPDLNEPELLLTIAWVFWCVQHIIISVNKNSY